MQTVVVGVAARLQEGDLAAEAEVEALAGQRSGTWGSSAAAPARTCKA